MQTLNELIKKCHAANEKIPKKYADFFPSIAYKKAFYCINPKQRGAELQIGLIEFARHRPLNWMRTPTGSQTYEIIGPTP